MLAPDDPALLLILPGFGDAVRCAGPALARLRALETLVARAHRAAGAEREPLVELECAYPMLAGAARLAHGPLSRLGDVGAHTAGWSARADPVHLAAVGDHLRLALPGALSLSDACALAATCNAALAHDGLALETPVAQRWYLRASRPFDFTAAATETVAGHEVFAHLPAGADGGYLRRVLTEMQMALHEHPVNAARERAGLLRVNSVWLWGGGELPAVLAAGPLPALSSDDPVARGLWRLAGASAHEWPAASGATMPGIVAIRACEQAARCTDAVRCAALLAQIDAELEAALAALRAGVIARVALRLGAAGDYSLDRRGLARWWRRARPLADLLAQR